MLIKIYNHLLSFYHNSQVQVQNNEEIQQNLNKINLTNPKFFENLNNNDYNKHLETINFNSKKDEFNKIDRNPNVNKSNANQLPIKNQNKDQNHNQNQSYDVDEKKNNPSSKTKDKCIVY